MRFAHSLAMAAVFVGAVAAQNTASLSITGTVNPGQTLAIGVTSNLSGGFCGLFVGNPATSTFTFGFNSLALAVQPTIILPLGMTDASGACGFSQSIPALPSNMPGSFAFPNHTFTCQAVVAKLAMTLPMPGMGGGMGGPGGGAGGMGGGAGGMGGGVPNPGSLANIFQTAVSNTATLVIGNG